MLVREVSGPPGAFNSEEPVLNVHAESNGVAFDLSDYVSGEVKRGAAVSEAYRVLREAILDGVIPPDTWLREESLTQLIGVSRTPIREALSRLDEEGLVERRSGSGVRVTRLTAEDMSIVYSIRGSLESVASQRIVAKATDRQVRSFRTIHEEMQQAAREDDSKTFNRLNLRFHHEFSVSADNAYLARLLATVEVAMRRFGSRSYSAERMQDILAEHELILDAFERRDAGAAADAAESHAESARRSTLSRLLGTE